MKRLRDNAIGHHRAGRTGQKRGDPLPKVESVARTAEVGKNI